MAAIEEQMQQNVQLKNEYFLADAINILLKRGALMRVEHVDTWLDTGTIESTLKANQYLLANSSIEPSPRSGVEIRKPVFIHDTSRVENSVIGPNASIGADCKIVNSSIENSIVDDRTEITNAVLKGSLIGRDCSVTGAAENGQGSASALNIGDNSEVRFDA
jgi:glucose-1-phosphate thymidylyltransferase